MAKKALDLTSFDDQVIETDNGLTDRDPVEQPSQDPNWVPDSVVDARGKRVAR